MEVDTEFNNLEVSDEQVDTLAFNIYKDINEYLNNNSTHFNVWLAYEIVTDAINELKDEPYKLENSFC